MSRHSRDFEVTIKYTCSGPSLDTDNIRTAFINGSLRGKFGDVVVTGYRGD